MKKRPIYDGKVVLGPIEKVKISTDPQKRSFLARIDTGAEKSSVDLQLASELHLGPIIRTKKVKSAAGTTIRPVVKVTIEIAGKLVSAHFTVAERTHMSFDLLIGRNVIEQGFLVDVTFGEEND